MAAPILQNWLNDVCAILRSGDSRRIRTTKDFNERFYKSFPASTLLGVHRAFLDYLEGTNPAGCPVKMDYPAGTTWEFFFQFDGQKTYGKILLRTDRRGVILFSAHLPERQKLRCD